MSYNCMADIYESVFVLCGKFAVSKTEGTDAFLSCMVMPCSHFLGAHSIYARVWSVSSSFSLSRPCEASHKSNEK